MSSIRSIIAKSWASLHHSFFQKWKEKPMSYQEELLLDLVKSASNTKFGKEHSFGVIKSIKDFQQSVSIFTYEKLEPYIKDILSGEEDVLWKGKPIYMAKTSGTTLGTKYIPITKDSMPFQVAGARESLLNYINYRDEADFVDGKMIFIQGSPELTEENGIKIGRLSGISAHYIPNYLQKNRLPSWETNAIEDWEEKIEKIVEETIVEDMTLISGIPPWLVMYFERVQQKTNKTIKEVFPNLQLLVTGGVNYEPYRNRINDLLGKPVDVIQTYPASEGFIAYQDNPDEDNLLLMVDHGIFYEFMPIEDIGKENPRRLMLDEVKEGVDYSIILTTNAGLWAYEIGDVVRFVNKSPYKIIVTGRTKHYTSAFGEHVIAYEVEEAMREVLERNQEVSINEFTMAPQVNPEEGLPYHEWFIEFENKPKNMTEFSRQLNEALMVKNSYYEDLIEGKVLRDLEISVIREGGFKDYMKQEGKLGGQNKLPRLANDRNIADKLTPFISK